jgi:hypothetical protein
MCKAEGWLNLSGNSRPAPYSINLQRKMSADYLKIIWLFASLLDVILACEHRLIVELLVPTLNTGSCLSL